MSKLRPESAEFVRDKDSMYWWAELNKLFSEYPEYSENRPDSGVDKILITLTVGVAKFIYGQLLHDRFSYVDTCHILRRAFYVAYRIGCRAFSPYSNVATGVAETSASTEEFK